MPIDETSGWPPYTSCCAPCCGEEHVGLAGQRRGVLHDADDAQSARSDLDVVADLRVRACSTPRPRPGLDGARPSDTAGIPGPRSGAPNMSTLRVASPASPCRRRRRAEPPRPRPGPRRSVAGRPARTAYAPTNGPDAPALTRNTIDAERVDGLLGLDPEPVGEPGEHERHREDDAGGKDRDDKAPSSPLHVAQRGDQHVREITDALTFAGPVSAMTCPWRTPRPACCRMPAGRRACGWTPTCLARASIRRPRRRPSWRRRCAGRS